MDLKEAKARMAELDKKSRQLEEDLQKRDDSQSAAGELGSID